MLASIRHFFRFIGLDETFDAHGFQVKVGFYAEQARATLKTTSEVPPSS